jgi:hypothetical protein
VSDHCKSLFKGKARIKPDRAMMETPVRDDVCHPLTLGCLPNRQGCRKIVNGAFKPAIMGEPGCSRVAPTIKSLPAAIIAAVNFGRVRRAVAPMAHHRHCINAQQRRLCSLNINALPGADGRATEWSSGATPDREGTRYNRAGVADRFNRKDGRPHTSSPSAVITSPALARIAAIFAQFH